MTQRQKKKKYSHEFKLEAVRLVESSDRPIAKIAEELGVPSTTLEGWIAKLGVSRPSSADEVTAPAARQPNSTDNEELVRLRRENERLRMERDFLKKATAFFANENK
jgi:transposase